jgi:hypothetical protein
MTTPAKIAAVRSLVRVVDDTQPGTLTSHLKRLERQWREAANDAERERTSRLTRAELASFSYDLDNPLRVDDCERCGFCWQACVCGSP